MKLVDQSRLPEWFRSRRTAAVFLTIHQGILILLVFVGIFLFIMVSWIMFFVDPSQVDFGDGENPSLGGRLFAIGFVFVWNIGVIACLRENTKYRRRIKEETDQP